MVIDNVVHDCSNCALRHNMCGYEPPKKNEECSHFEIGKCFICSLRFEEGMCYAEDWSGYNCPNYKS